MKATRFANRAWAFVLAVLMTLTLIAPQALAANTVDPVEPASGKILVSQTDYTLIDGVTESAPDGGHARESLVKICTGGGEACADGDLHDISVRNVVASYAESAFYANTRLVRCTLRNIHQLTRFRRSNQITASTEQRRQARRSPKKSAGAAAFP